MSSTPFLDLLLRRREPRVGAVVGIVAAVVVHVAAVPGSAVLPVRAIESRASGSAFMLGQRMPAAAPTRIEISRVAAARPPVVPPPGPAEPEPKGQVVDLPADVVARPDAADFLAPENQRAERETRAKTQAPSTSPTRAPSLTSTGAALASTKAAPVQNGATGGPQGDGAGRSGDALVFDSASAGGATEVAHLEVRRVEGSRAPEAPPTTTGTLPTPRPARDGNSVVDRVAFGRLAPEPDNVGRGDGDSGVGRAGGDRGDVDVGHLFLDATTLARRAGLPQNDHLLLEEGDETALNAFEWRHATYFNRIADAVRREWQGALALRKSDPDGRVFGSADRVTVVHVVIDEAGNVVDVAVRDASGAGPLEDEALRALRAAAPFPHPPPGLFRTTDRYGFDFSFAVNFDRARVDLNWRP